MNIQKIFITGGTGDLGTALVREILAKKNTYVVTNGRDESKAKSLIESLNSDEQKRFRFINADLSKESPEETARRAYEVYGGIDMLISNVALFEFDEILENDESRKKLLYDTNLGGLKLAEEVVKYVTEKGEHIVLCDIGSTSVIADMLGEPFYDTVHYGKTKADVVRHSIRLAHTNNLVTFRAIHPGSINGKFAQQIADKYKDTYVTTPEITAKYAIDLFFTDSEEKVIQEIFTSEKYFAWTREGSWYKKELEIVESGKIEGLTYDRIITIPVDNIHSFQKTRIEKV